MPLPALRQHFFQHRRPVRDDAVDTEVEQPCDLGGVVNGPGVHRYAQCVGTGDELLIDHCQRALFDGYLGSRSRGAAHRRKAQRSDAAGVAPGAGALRGLRVLVVDDQEDAREALRVILDQAGVEVTVAASSAEALATQARQIADGLPRAGQPVDSNREIVALIAYLQRLGTDIKPRPAHARASAGTAGAGGL